MNGFESRYTTYDQVSLLLFWIYIIFDQCENRMRFGMKNECIRFILYTPFSIFA